jgi:hypothetical protein
MNEKSTRPSLKKLLIANAILWIAAILIMLVTPHFVSSPEKATLPQMIAMLLLFGASCRNIIPARTE